LGGKAWMLIEKLLCIPKMSSGWSLAMHNLYIAFLIVVAASCEVVNTIPSKLWTLGVFSAVVMRIFLTEM